MKPWVTIQEFTQKTLVSLHTSPPPTPSQSHLFFCRFRRTRKLHKMVIPPPVRPPRILKFLKPYVLKMHFTNKYVSAQVIHSPTATVASAASSQEKALRSSMESTRDVAAASKIGKILAERLLLKEIPAVSVSLKREQKYHGKVKAVIDSLREAGVKLL
ncbi:50S ribosomal protein L18-like [Gossypium australe]|uniref:50S ribosomal protein L18-like n=1 Tax=Gossypium australe TaxID=47621 RepID=A0A5B6VI30_9ROSI|nr:50S ribosomal protein L18-like [Gossypium australe]